MTRLSSLFHSAPAGVDIEMENNKKKMNGVVRTQILCRVRFLIPSQDKGLQNTQEYTEPQQTVVQDC